MVQRTGEKFIELKNGYIICYREQRDKKEQRVDFLMNKKPPRNIENFYSVIE